MKDCKDQDASLDAFLDRLDRLCPLSKQRRDKPAVDFHADHSGILHASPRKDK